MYKDKVAYKEALLEREISNFKKYGCDGISSGEMPLNKSYSRKNYLLLFLNEFKDKDIDIIYRQISRPIGHVDECFIVMGSTFNPEEGFEDNSNRLIAFFNNLKAVFPVHAIFDTIFSNVYDKDVLVNGITNSNVTICFVSNGIFASDDLPFTIANCSALFNEVVDDSDDVSTLYSRIRRIANKDVVLCGNDETESWLEVIDFPNSIKLHPLNDDRDGLFIEVDGRNYRFKNIRLSTDRMVHSDAHSPKTLSFSQLPFVGDN